MEYIVIELNEEPHIITINEVNSNKTHIEGKSGHFNVGGEPIIFKDKNTAFRVADECRKGLVYPIVDVMNIFDRIKTLCKDHIPENKDDKNLLEELLILTDEIV